MWILNEVSSFECICKSKLKIKLFIKYSKKSKSKTKSFYQNSSWDEVILSDLLNIFSGRVGIEPTTLSKGSCSADWATDLPILKEYYIHYLYIKSLFFFWIERLVSPLSLLIKPFNSKFILDTTSFVSFLISSSEIVFWTASVISFKTWDALSTVEFNESFKSLTRSSSATFSLIFVTSEMSDEISFQLFFHKKYMLNIWFIFDFKFGFCKTLFCPSSGAISLKNGRNGLYTSVASN